MSTQKHTIYVINTADSGRSYWNRGGVAFAKQGRELHVQARHPSSDEVPAS